MENYIPQIHAMNIQMIEALDRIGSSVFNGAFSTFLAVVALANSQTYIFRVFFRQFFLVTLIGSVHGLIVLPVLLSMFGPNSSVIPMDEEEIGDKDKKDKKNKDKDETSTIAMTEKETIKSDTDYATSDAGNDNDNDNNNNNNNERTNATAMNPISEEEAGEGQRLNINNNNNSNSKHKNQSTLPSMDVEDVAQAFNQ